MSQSETITNTRTIFEGKVLTLKLHDVRLEDGRESKREIVEHRGAVALVPIDGEGNVVMIRQFRLAAGGILLEIPAGTVDPGEEPIRTAYREIVEEIGMEAGTMEELGAFFVSPGWCTEKIRIYLATDLSPARQDLDEDEVIEVVTLSLEDALQKVREGEIQDAKSITGLLLASQRLIGG